MKKSRLALITLSVLLGGTAIGVLMKQDLPKLMADKAERMSSSIPPRINPFTDWRPNETMTGNILAANFAQNRRDWERVDQYMANINSQIDDNDFTRLRLMLLALTAGQHERAATLAKTVQDNPVPTGPDAEMLREGRNMSALVLLANAVRGGDLDEAQKHLDSISAESLRALLGHILAGWLDAAAGKQLSPDVRDTAFLPAFHRALAAEWSGQLETATKIMDQLSDTVLTPEAVQMIAAFHLRHGNPEQAKSVLTRALEHHPMDRHIKDLLKAIEGGITKLKRDEWEYHLQGASAGIAQALRDLAHYMSTQESGDSALIFGQMGRMIRSDVPRLNVLVGTIYQDDGRNADARALYAATPKDAPDYIDAQIHLAELDAKMDNPTQAIKTLEDLLKSKPSPRVAYALGEMQRTNQNYAESVKAYDKAVELSGGEASDELWSVYFVRAMANDELGNWEKSEKDLLKALEYRPDNAHVLNYLGYSYADKGVNLDKAKNMVIKALTQMPLDPYTIDSLGWVYFKEGDYPQSLLFLERAVSLKPYDPTMNEHLGDLYEKMGRKIEANYQWRRALTYANKKTDGKLIERVREKLANGLKD